MDTEKLLANQHDEPILSRSSDRFHFHVTDVELRRMYEEHFELFWTPKEINPTADLSDWASLTDAERAFISHVLAFFAAADGIVFENIQCNFGNEVTIPEARFFYGFQGMMENVHSETYMKILQTYITDEAEQARMINAVTTIPSIKAKAEWALQYLDGALPFALRLVAFAVVEGIFFSGSFCAIFWLKSQRPGMLEALTFSNQLISRDEGLHTAFAIALFHRLLHKPSEALVHEIVSSAVKNETVFTLEALQVSLIGMTSESMSQHIQFVADRLLRQLGYATLYNVSDPFSFMEAQSLRVTTNFFEGKVAEYALAPEGNFAIDADF
jgi:ribonucleoside-diphosphate reductase beta chain